MKFIEIIKNKLFGNTPKTIQTESIEDPAEMYFHSKKFYYKEDLVYLEKLNAYGAFKFKVVKDILLHQEKIGVSDIHLQLNGVYFSLDEKIHQHNKRAAIQHLGFLDKSLQFSDNEFIKESLLKLLSLTPKETPISLSKYIINPLIFINILKEFGFLEGLSQFQLAHPDFNYENFIEIIHKLFEDDKELGKFFISLHQNNQEIPPLMQALIDDFRQVQTIANERLPYFFASMVYAATHSTSSFISSISRYFLQVNVKERMQMSPESIYKIANEIVRIHTPVPYIFRTVRQSVEYAGHQLNTGDTVLLFIGSANLDPSVFEDPYQIKIDCREKHLAFGRGQYVCIGQSASFRLGLNFIEYLKPHLQKIHLLDENSRPVLHNGMIKVNTDVIIRN